MALTINDLQPKEFTIEVKGVELKCKPIKLGHALVLMKASEVLNNPYDKSKEQIDSAEQDIKAVLTEIIPDLANIDLDLETTVELIDKVTQTMTPAENKELKEAGVDFEKKVQEIG